MSALVFQEERWADYAAEARALWPLHWHELYDGRLSETDAGRLRMRINEPWYVEAERQGALSIVTARAAGELVGYVICGLTVSSHYADLLVAHEDTYWLSPAHRTGLAGARLIRFAEAALAARGVQRVFFMSHENRPLDRLFRFLRYRKTHVVYARWIGD